jgi:hypothetical protein
LIGKRKLQNINSFGYFYKESKKLAKSCTYTKIFTREELESELKLEQKIKLQFEIHNNKLKDLKAITPYLCPIEYIKFANICSGFCGKAGFFDLRNYYKSLKFHEIPITKQWLIDNQTNFDQEKIYSQSELALIGSVRIGNSYDVVFVEEQSAIDQLKGFVIGRDIKYDAISDIKIYGATYAKLK